MYKRSVRRVEVEELQLFLARQDKICQMQSEQNQHDRARVKVKTPLVQKKKKYFNICIQYINSIGREIERRRKKKKRTEKII